MFPLPRCRGWAPPACGASFGLAIHRLRVWIAASLVFALACPGSCSGVKFPPALAKGLVLRLESDQDVEIDAESSDPEPPVLGWGDLSGSGRRFKVNETLDSNAQQRERNRIEDGTRPTEETNKLPRAKRRAEDKLHDSAPARVICPVLNVPAVFFDGDDYMFLLTDKEKDKLTPGKGAMTVVALISMSPPEEGQSHFFNHWFGLGHPGIMSDSQYTLHTRGEEEEEVFGKEGKKKPPKPLIGDPQGFVSIRVVPVQHDPETPSVREHAEVEAKMTMGKPQLVSYVMTGKQLQARVNGDEKPFKAAQQGFTEGAWNYHGKVDPHDDVPGTHFYLGAGPSAEHLIDFTGEGAYGMLYGLLVFRGRLQPKGLAMAETYLACHFGYEDKCDREIGRKAGILHEEL